MQVKRVEKVILKAFPELSAEDKELFLPEYNKKRIEAAAIADNDGLFDLHFHGFLIFGEKI